jgi:hypothetical protein
MGGEGDLRWNGTQEMEVRSTGIVVGGGRRECDRGFSEERVKLREKISLQVEKVPVTLHISQQVYQLLGLVKCIM